MEKYLHLAKNFTKRDKSTVDSLWQELAEKLNCAGPPQKDVNRWRKVKKCLRQIILQCIKLWCFLPYRHGLSGKVKSK